MKATTRLRLFATFLCFPKVVGRVSRFQDDDLRVVALNVTHIVVGESAVELNAFWKVTFNILELLPANPERIHAAGNLIRWPHSLENKALPNHHRLRRNIIFCFRRRRSRRIRGLRGCRLSGYRSSGRSCSLFRNSRLLHWLTCLATDEHLIRLEGLAGSDISALHLNRGFLLRGGCRAREQGREKEYATLHVCNLRIHSIEVRSLTDGRGTLKCPSGT